MPNAAQVNFKVTNVTQTVGAPSQGINWVLGRSLRGAFAKPDKVFNSWADFVKHHGGLMTTSDAPLNCKRLLEKGGRIRFCRVGHYTDPTDRSTLDAVKAELQSVIKLTFDAALVVGNTIDLDINGNAIATVNFNTDNDTTLDDLAEEIADSDLVESATVVENLVSNNTILIVPAYGVTLVVDGISVLAGASQANGAATEVASFVTNEGVPMFDIVMKNEGADYNKFRVSLKAASNGTTGYFDLVIYHNEDSNIVETYQNLIINGNPDENASSYLKTVSDASAYIDVVYHDLSGTTGQVVPLVSTMGFTGGSDGTTPVAADYIGDSNATNGFYAFDEYDDSMQLGVFDNDTDAIHIAGSAYAANRKDVIYYIPIPTTLANKSAIVTKRDSYNIDNKFAYIFGGGTQILNPLTSNTQNNTGLADLFALINYTDRNFGEWFSFAGPRRGLIANVFGVVNNFGTPAKFADLNELANKQVNMIVNKDGSPRLSGNFSAQLANDQEKFISVVRLVIFLKKALRPTLENFLEEPCDIPTWKQMYFSVKPFLDSLVTKRALYEYTWNGDQFASGLDNLQVNDATDVSNGKYKVNFAIKAIPSIQEINVNIILTPGGISFETVTEII